MTLPAQPRKKPCAPWQRRRLHVLPTRSEKWLLPVFNLNEKCTQPFLGRRFDTYHEQASPMSQNTCGCLRRQLLSKNTQERKPSISMCHVKETRAMQIQVLNYSRNEKSMQPAANIVLAHKSDHLINFRPSFMANYKQMCLHRRKCMHSTRNWPAYLDGFVQRLAAIHNTSSHSVEACSAQFSRQKMRPETKPYKPCLISIRNCG